jgi:hypothetical protein
MSRKVYSEKDIEDLYKSLVIRLDAVVPGDVDNFTLHRYCRRVIGTKFKGVYPSNRIPILINNESCIINTDPAGFPGTHWLSFYKCGEYLYCYDSFGRDLLRIIPDLFRVYPYRFVKYDKKDREQMDEEINCGARCVAWLLICYDYSPMDALKI